MISLKILFQKIDIGKGFKVVTISTLVGKNSAKFVIDIRFF